MPTYQLRQRFIQATRYDGDPAPVEAAAALLPVVQRPPQGPPVIFPTTPSLSILAGHVSVWNAARGTWDYMTIGDWLVLGDHGLYVLSDAEFQDRFEPAS